MDRLRKMLKVGKRNSDSSIPIQIHPAEYAHLRFTAGSIDRLKKSWTRKTSTVRYNIVEKIEQMVSSNEDHLTDLQT